MSGCVSVWDVWVIHVVGGVEKIIAYHLFAPKEALGLSFATSFVACECDLTNATVRQSVTHSVVVSFRSSSPY